MQVSSKPSWQALIEQRAPKKDEGDKPRYHKAVCKTCMRPLDVWPDKVLHKDARFDIDCYPYSHKAELL